MRSRPAPRYSPAAALVIGAALDRFLGDPGRPPNLLVESLVQRDLPAELRARRIAVRPAANFPRLADTFFRATARSAAANSRPAHSLAEVIPDG